MFWLQIILCKFKLGFFDFTFMYKNIHIQYSEFWILKASQAIDIQYCSVMRLDSLREPQLPVSCEITKSNWHPLMYFVAKLDIGRVDAANTSLLL